MNMQLDLPQLFNVLGDAVVVVDGNGNIVGWNAAATRIFGFSEAEALGHSLTLIIPERLRHRHNVGFDKSMETGTTRYGSQLLKVPATHKDGRTLSMTLLRLRHVCTAVAMRGQATRLRRLSIPLWMATSSVMNLIPRKTLILNSR